MKRFAALPSYLFHPVFVPVYGVLLFFWLDVNRFSSQQKWMILAQVALVGTLIPIAFFILLRLLGKVDSLMIPVVEQRRLPLFFQMTLFFLLLYRSFTEEVAPPLHYFFLAALFSSGIALVLSYLSFRASLHLLGMGGLLGFAIGLGLHNGVNDYVLLSGLCLLAGWVGTSRLALKAHDMREVGWGTAIGLVPQLAFVYFWL